MSTVMHELCRQTVHYITVEVKNGSVEALDRSTEVGIAARVVLDGRQGFAYSTRPDASEKELIKMASLAARNTDPDPFLCFPAGTKAAIRTPLEAFSKITIEQKIGIAKDLEAKILGYSPLIRGARKPLYDEVIKNVHITNSNGADVSFSHAVCAVRATAIADDGNGPEWTTEIRYGLDPANLDLKETAETAAQRAVSYLGGRAIASCHTPCLFHRNVATDILGVLASSFFADALFGGKTMLSGKLSEKIFSDRITIVDDATLKEGFSSVPFDAEGALAKRTVLVENGILKGFLSDTSYAKKANVSHSSSSTRSSITQPPKIGVHNLHVLAGKSTPADLMRLMNRGLHVTDVLGLHTANPITGDFSVGAAGYWIENGVPTHGVKGITIAGNLHELFKKIVGTGSDLKFKGSAGSPSILVEEVAVSGN